MLLPTTIPGAIGIMLLGVLLLGCWPVLWDAVERRGRPAAHIFLDYTLAYLALALAAALTLGQLGPAPPQFADQLAPASLAAVAPLVAFAAGGGACLALGDLGMQYATAALGLAVGPSLLNAVTLLVGVLLAFFLDGGINSPALVFPGLACAGAAIALGAAAHVAHGAQAAAAGSVRGASSGREPAAGPTGAEGLSGSKQEQQQQQQQQQDGTTAAATSAAAAAAAAGAPGALVIDCRGEAPPPPRPAKPRPERAIQLAGQPRWLGPAIAVVGGLIYGCFLPAFQVAATDPFGLSASEPLSVYSAFFFFAVAFAAASLAINVLLLYRPVWGAPRSSLAAWLADGGRGRWLSLLSGLVAAGGDLAQFIGGQVAGYAACFLVLCYPLLSALAGLLRGEFRPAKSSSRSSSSSGSSSGSGSCCLWQRGWWARHAAQLLLGAQVAAFAAAVGLLAGSAELRPH